jgi:hypothetical protein
VVIHPPVMLWILLPHLRTRHPWRPQPLPPYLLFPSHHRQRILLQVSFINAFFHVDANLSRIIAENLPESPSGHLVSVLMFFNSQVAGPVGRGSKLVTKKSKVTKSGHIVLEGISRTSFITAFLSVHGLSDQYSPGVHSGPAFKFFWTGSV